MTEELKQITQEEIAKLSSEHQRAIASVDWASISENIGKKYLLDESEINDLQSETLVVLLGLVEPEDYAKNIEDEIGLTQEESESISKEVTEKIFIPVNTALVEKIKQSYAVKNPTWEQNLDFILSGGNYAAFMEQRDDIIENKESKTQ